jgi:hypothetical protein
VLPAGCGVDEDLADLGQFPTQPVVEFVEEACQVLEADTRGPAAFDDVFGSCPVVCTHGGAHAESMPRAA